ncbi:LOW QUALITY PROTEIN: hypothetical protein OSB04_011471 [Centaurea solstitialis]|uniref:Pentatricopeptide repeat-containing protein n=1 Tax=Centaurea solstitialis TaxID=347529 RepID=A0AA38TSK1_9ASTR|nr:LOW QUALITY PROTEIN: hypothetical protein OSB04_011471 [Centaurea solstitialis]
MHSNTRSLLTHVSDGKALKVNTSPNSTEPLTKATEPLQSDSQRIRVKTTKLFPKSALLFDMLKGIISPSSLLFTKTPFGFPSQRILSHFHSDSASNHQPKFDRPPSIYEKITKLDHALQLFDQMTQRQPLPSVFKFNHLLQAVSKMKQYSNVIDLFKQMVAIGAPVNVYTTTIVIKSCCQMSCTNQGFAILAYGLRRGVVPNVHTFSTLLNGLILEDRILEAEKLFKKLIKGKFCVPNVVMYNTMIKGLCKFGINETAIALVKLMDERDCKPDVVTYNTVIDSLCKDQMVHDALNLFKDMIFHKHILPTVVTYNSLIHGLCNIGRWDDVLKMLKEMEEDERTSPNIITFTILVDAFCKEGFVEHAVAVMNLMVERGKDPDLVTYNSLIDGYCLRGEVEKAKGVFDSMRIRGVIPDVVTYGSLLNGYCKSLKIDEAMHLYETDVVTYNTMIQGLFQVGRCKAAHKLFKEMQSNNQIPNVMTYRIILEGLCNNKQIDDALSLFRLMGDSKLNSNIVVYNILMDGACKCGKLDIARDLFGDVTVKGLQHDVRSYTIMISGFYREGLVREAKELFLQMDERGCPPNCATYNVLLYGLLKNKQLDTIESLLQEMDGRGFLLTAATLSMLFAHITPRSADANFLKLIAEAEKCLAQSERIEKFQNEKAEFEMTIYTKTSAPLVTARPTSAGEGNEALLIRCVDTSPEKYVKPTKWVLIRTNVVKFYVFNLVMWKWCGKQKYIGDALRRSSMVREGRRQGTGMMMITTPKKTALLFFNMFKGIISPSLLLFTKTPFEFASQTQRILAHFYSNSASNHQQKFDRPPSIYEKITKLDDALQLFDQMTQRQPLPSVVKFNHLLQTVSKMKHYSHVIYLFKQMVAIGAPVNVYTTTIVIKCCCQMCCTSQGFEIVAYGLRRGVVPDVYTFSTLLNGLILEDRILEAEKLFKKLIKGKFCVANVVMYSTMIKGLCKCGINETAIALVKLMEERGCKPDVVTYNTVIDSLCKDQMVDDAIKLFKDMIFHKGILPSVVTYTSLIRGLCSIGRWDDVLKCSRKWMRMKRHLQMS